jgi:hypothetical protein
MLPYMNEVPIGREYFDKEMEDQIIDSTLTDYFSEYGDNTGLIKERDYRTNKYEMGTNDPSTGTGFNTLFNTLGSYNYEINPPAAGADPSVTITDRYDWNPTYGERRPGELGFVEQGGTDVTTPMLMKHLLLNQRPTSLGGSGFDFANTAEMIGNYFGHRQSKGQGRDVNITIPITNEKFKRYQASANPKPYSLTKNILKPSPKNKPRIKFNMPPKGAAGFSGGGIVSLMI